MPLGILVLVDHHYFDLPERTVTEIKSGQLTLLTFFKYTLGTLLINAFFYLLAGAVSIASWFVGFIIVMIFLGSTVSDESL